MILNRNNKKISFYVAQDKKNISKFLTLTCTKQEAVDFCYKYMRIQNFNHFKLWCVLRELNVDDENAWKKYYDNVISIEEKKQYIITKITYKLNDVAAILRMFGGCLPVGCSFDTKEEYNYLNYRLETQKATKDLAQNLQEAFEKAKEELEKEKDQENVKQ